MRVHFEVTDITGTTWIGDEGDVTVDQRKQVEDLFDKGLYELGNFSILINGQSRHFNASHIVTVGIVES